MLATAMDPTSLLSIFLLLLVLLKWILERRKLFSTFERLGIPGPKPSFFTGNLSLVTKSYADVQLAEKYGPIYGFFIGAKPLLAVTDPELLKIVQVKESRKFHFRYHLVPEVGVPSRIFHLSIPLATGQRWKENRDSLTQAYTASKFKMMNGILNKELDRAIATVTKCAEKGHPVDLEEIYTPLFWNTFLQVTLGIKLNTEETEALKVMVDSMKRATLPSLSTLSVFLSASFPELESVLSWFNSFWESKRGYLKFSSLDKVQDMCDAAISARVEEKGSNYADVLQLMVNKLRKEKERTSKITTNGAEEHINNYHIQEEDLRANALYLSIASYDPLRAAASYGTYELAKSPRVQEKLRKEILEINGNKDHISYDNLLKMKYLSQVYDEVLRLYPSAPFFTNRIAREEYYYKGKLIPKGTIVYVPQLALMRSASNFCDPESFMPERFDDRSKIDPYIYQPFGIGPRHCPGMRLSQYFGKITLARMVQSFNLSLDPTAKEVTPDFHLIVNRPKGPVRIIASPI